MSLLEVKDLAKHFGGVRALDGCTLSIEEGKVTGLIGPNGSGKTTMFNAITGYQPVDAGSVSFRGRSITNHSPEQVSALGIGRTFQLTRVFGRLSVRENLLVGSRAVPRARRGELYRAERLSQMLDFVGLLRLESETAGALSYGQRKLLELAIVLAQDVSVILLDEPAGGINPTLIAQLGERIKELNGTGKTFLVVEHNMEFVMGLCDTVAVMERGRVIAQGPPEQVRNDPRVLDAYLGGSLDEPEPSRAQLSSRAATDEGGGEG